MYSGKYQILKNKITACDYAYLLKEINVSLKKKRNLFISPVASQTLVKSYFNSTLRRKLDQFDFLVPDSQWVRFSLYFLYKIWLQDRVYGPELMIKICNISQKEGYNVFLYGSSRKTLEKLRVKLLSQFPQIKIVGLKSFNYKKKVLPLDRFKITQLMKKNKVDILFLGIGSPLQEQFSIDMFKNYTQKDRSIVVIPVGAAFDFISKVKPQAPKWMQDKGLEWFFRLLSEPQRLWKRYLVLGSLFIFFVFIQKIYSILTIMYPSKR